MSVVEEMRACNMPGGERLCAGRFVTSKSRKNEYIKIERIFRKENLVKLEGSLYVPANHSYEIIEAFKVFGVQPVIREIVKLADQGVIELYLSDVKNVAPVRHICIVDPESQMKGHFYYTRFMFSKGRLTALKSLKPTTPKLSVAQLQEKREQMNLRKTPRSCKKILNYCEAEKENVSPAKKAKTANSTEEWRDSEFKSPVSDDSDSDSSDLEELPENSPSSSPNSDGGDESPELVKGKSSRDKKPAVKPKVSLKKAVPSQIGSKPHANLLSYRAPLSLELERICSLNSGFDQALAMLQVSSVPLELPCREVEFGNIFSFVHDHLSSGTSGCMYVSGTPGTGKTATVLEVISYLNELSKEKEVPSFKYIEVNGMKLTAPQQVYSEIWYQFRGIHLGVDASLAALEDTFLREQSTNRRPVVLLVDELDLLLTNKQDILYNLFEWPSSKAQSKLIIVCIANTMDLPERVMMKRVSSRLGMTRVVFQPYTHGQLKQIISSRVQSSGVFAEPAVEFAARKMSALSGDARRSLDICRRATEIAQTSKCKIVDIKHITEAFNEMFSSKKMTALKKCSVHEKLFLKSIVSEFRKCGLEEAQMINVYKQYRTICNLEGQIPLEATVMLRLAANLDAMKLIVFEGCKFGLNQKVILNTSVDDVNFAMAKE